jgi:transposase
MVAVSHFLTTMNRRPWMKHIGFDVDSTTTHISVFSERGREILHTKIATREADLVAFMRSIPGPKRVTLEESQMADFVTRIIEPYAAKVIRCLPQHNRLISESEHKYDRADARSLAELLFLNKLKEVHHASWEYRRLREGVRAYWVASRDLSRTKSQLKAFYLFNGVHCTGEKVYAPRYRAAFTKQVEKRWANMQILAQLYLQLDFCRTKKATHIKILKELVRYFKEDERNLKTYPGIGLIGACALIAYLENGWRVRNKRKLLQYCGIGVRRRESAGKGHRKASRQGNRYLKNAVMTAAATIANRRIADNALTKMWRAGIAAGVAGDRMKRNMARKVAVLAQRSLRFKEEYHDDRVATTP